MGHKTTHRTQLIPWTEGNGSSYNCLISDYTSDYYTQIKKNRSIPLPYAMDLRYMLPGYISVYQNGTLGNGPNCNSVGGPPDLNNRTCVDANNRAYNSMINQLNDYVSTIGNNIGEREQAVHMIANKASQILKGFKALKRFDLPRVANAFGISLRSVRKAGLKRGAKHVADNFLALHFGWEPLAKDIYGAVQACIQPPRLPRRALVGKATGSINSSNRFIDSGYTTSTTTSTVFHVKCGCVVTLTSENLALASQLGLVNPVGVLWEVTPWSFVVDWFANVGQVIASATDFVGFNVSNGYTTNYAIRDDTTYTYGPPGNHYLVNAGVRYVLMRRTLGTPSPRLALKPLKAPSVVRAATAISLLVQQLKH